ncbi:bifunctional diguanylate cyclase/phosphodiesterase [Clostridium cylindrosporum]|uniref:Diguanylate cyclase (GGDEF) domain-containing protein n=1 Tax=Clostridium cylindrosporum DSM 605 TaxID=1121307 RepID=A0A0J8D9Y9_CLOCY|nr:EAL domain-containing protein [Clostridium cylindrosporum]KMT22870.1 diguanylate cyclase (GGDEF) domain-containing protein [Clostridium cylindrosporum DSM 605]
MAEEINISWINRKKFMKTFILLTILLVFFSTITFWYVNKIKGVLSYEEEMYLKEVSLQRSHAFSTKIKSRVEALNDLSVELMYDVSFDINKKVELLRGKKDKDNYIALGIADISGNYLGIGGRRLNISKEKGFKVAMSGKDYVSEPFLDKGRSLEVMTYYSPLIKDGKVVGVLTGAKDVESISKSLFTSFLNGNGHSFVINKKGDILFEDSKIYSILDLDKLRSSGTILKELGISSLQGKSVISGVKKISLERGDVHIAYTTIEGVNDWILVSVAPSSIVEKRAVDITKYNLIMYFTICIILFIFTIYIFVSKKRANKIYQKLAYTDYLTGISNYNGFVRDAEKNIAKKSGTWAMIYFDIGSFKVINDMFGHKYGDKLLKEIAKILKGMFGNETIYGRFSNDFFGILFKVPEEEDEPLVTDDISMYAELLGHIRDGQVFNPSYTNLKITHIVSEIEKKINSIKIEGQPHIDLLMAYGVCTTVSDKGISDDIKSVINMANMARITVKGSYQRRLAFFNEAIRQDLIDEQNIEKEIVRALENNEFQVYYQPKYELSTEGMVGAEALIRWIHPVKGLIRPDKFIPIAERTGFIIPIGRFVLRSVCESIKEWERKNYKLVPISVNFSRAEMYQSDFIDKAIETITENEVNPELIEIELTESAALNDVEFATNTIMGFKNFGVKVSIDDFGTGYSCLSYLKSMPIDILKIDRSFITDIEENDKGKNIVEAIIGLAKSLNLSVVSEGVETESQTNFLKKVGCDLVQGYAFNRPMPKDDFEDLMK